MNDNGFHSTAASLPPVAGRHRDHALAAARRTRAVQLRTQGWTYEAIAQKLGYTSRATVFAIVRKALDAHEAERWRASAPWRPRASTGFRRAIGARP